MEPGARLALPCLRELLGWALPSGGSGFASFCWLGLGWGRATTGSLPLGWTSQGDHHGGGLSRLGWDEVWVGCDWVGLGGA